MMDSLGWAGSVLLAICAIPEAYHTLKYRRVRIGWGMLLTWYLGEILTLIPVVFKIHSGYLILNYALNTIIITYLVYMKATRKKRFDKAMEMCYIDLRKGNYEDI